MRGLKKVTSGTALGGTNRKKFKIGDLIEWSSLTTSRNTHAMSIRERFRGVIIEFYVETATGREVSMARILPVGNHIVVEVPCAILKKVETT